MNGIQRNEVAAACVALTLMLSPVTNGQPSPQSTTQQTSMGASSGQLDADATERSHLEDLGDLFLVRGRYMDAISAFRQGAGDSPVMWNKLGIAYQHLFNIKSARECYERSLKLNPQYAEAMNNLGTVLYAEKNYSGASRYYKKALKLSPHSAIIYVNLGTAQFGKGDYKHGARAFKEAFTIDPGVFDSHSENKIEESGSRAARAMLKFHLARFYAQARMNDQALECLKEALDNGFNDRKQIMGDDELAELRETDAFRKLMTEQGLR
jgi:tetratricopeptide (TPR) repeat protein